MCADEPLARRWRRFHHTFVALAFFGFTLAYAVMLLVRQQFLFAWSSLLDCKPPIAFMGIYVCHVGPSPLLAYALRMTSSSSGRISQTAILEIPLSLAHLRLSEYRAVQLQHVQNQSSLSDH